MWWLESSLNLLIAPIPLVNGFGFFILLVKIGHTCFESATFTGSF
jgi:hypothetical protein